MSNLPSQTLKMDQHFGRNGSVRLAMEMAHSGMSRNGTQWNFQKCMSWLISSILFAEISIAKKRGEVAVTNHSEIQLTTLQFLSPGRQTSFSNAVVIVELEEQTQ